MTRTIYTVLLYLLLPFAPLKLLWRSRKQPEYLQHWAERFGFYTATVKKPIIWLHCVSVGETRAASLLVKLLQAEYPAHQVLLTHITPTGRATSEQLFGESVQRAYLPYDTPGAAARFLAHYKPSIGVLMETELWFNLIHACKDADVPLLLLNARLSEKSASGYAKLGKLVQEGLHDLTAIGAQTIEDSRRLQALGAKSISVMGNIKFEVMPPKNAVMEGEKLRARLKAQSRPVFLAASTRDDNGRNEESMIIEAVRQANIPDLLTIIVPRHPQRFDEIAELLRKKGHDFMRRSQLLVNGNAIREPGINEEALKGEAVQKVRQDADDVDDKVIMKQFLLGDSMGEMFTYYAACDVAFIGGSLLPLGGQNLIEALAMNKPVLIGPHTLNFAQASKSAIDAGAALRVHDSQALAQTLKMLFTDHTKRQKMVLAIAGFSEKNGGATGRALTLIKQYLATR